MSRISQLTGIKLRFPLLFFSSSSGAHKKGKLLSFSSNAMNDLKEEKIMELVDPDLQNLSVKIKFMVMLKSIISFS
jgi:hypothetical protein